MKKDITELYCCVEDFCRTVDDNFASMLLSKGRKPTRIPGITSSEILTIILLYHQSPCKNFKEPFALNLIISFDGNRLCKK